MNDTEARLRFSKNETEKTKKQGGGIWNGHHFSYSKNETRKIRNGFSKCKLEMLRTFKLSKFEIFQTFENERL